jgi:hypothetical protein
MSTVTADGLHLFFDGIKLLVLPAFGFLAGIAAQWALQDRKSRDELTRALAPRRAEVLCRLWTVTTLPTEVASTPLESPIPVADAQTVDRTIVDWYTKEAGALYLSHDATRLVFALLDTLRNRSAKHADLETAVTRLRTQLKRDCGIYSRSESRRSLERPRRAEWP